MLLSLLLLLRVYSTLSLLRRGLRLLLLLVHHMLLLRLQMLMLRLLLRMLLRLLRLHMRVLAVHLVMHLGLDERWTVWPVEDATLVIDSGCLKLATGIDDGCGRMSVGS